MALPRHLKSGLTPLEIEFLAENEPIEISASIDSRQDLDLLGGTVQALKPLRVNKVPLWLAITLKKKHKCNIVIPPWMTAESLQELLKAEQDDSDRFGTLPFHYMETAQLLFENACDDIPSADHVRTLLKDIREARQSKARRGVEFLGSSSYIRVDNIGLMELNEIRPFFTKAFFEIEKIRSSINTEESFEPNEDTYRGFDERPSFGGSIPESSRFNTSQYSRSGRE
ncbi:DNA replication protein psf2 [Lunasporangiospora selenospora]|uniref:DNA replication complex GINS protein PSF2 n=1 Tax=Lunasporangiospora selenospora TaxID=979761 RepID=A0A9P6FKZ0_9FUNG|nr:DNA replication protein psf2 [Lunasporangiospora selenospora]